MAENTNEDFFESSQHLLQQYVKDRLLLLKMDTAEKTAKLASLFSVFIIIASLCSLILIFLSIAMGYFFAEKTGSLFYGFGIVALFYLVLLILVLIIKKKYLETFVTNTVIKVFFEPTAHEPTEGNHQS